MSSLKSHFEYRLKSRVTQLPLLAFFFICFYAFYVTPLHAAGIRLADIPAETAQQSCSDIIDIGVKWLNKYNLTALNDIKALQTVEGRTFVGHDFASGNSANIGVAINGSTSTCNGDALTVVNVIQGGNPLSIAKGGVRFGNSRGSRIINFSDSQGCTVSQDATLTTAFASQVQSNMLAFSAQLATMPANNTAPVRDGNFNIIYAVNTKTTKGLAIFTLSADQAFPSGNTNTIDIVNSANATTILINVTGQNINFQTGNLGNFFNANNKANSSKIIWNFPQALTVNTDRQLIGALLAPQAILQTQQSLNGSVVVKDVNIAGPVNRTELALANLDPILGSCPAPASMTLSKRTNGLFAPSAPGPFIPVGDPVAWSFTFTNTGEVALQNITLSDSHLGVITSSCTPAIPSQLQINGSFTCSVNGTATQGQYKNVALVAARPVDSTAGVISATATSHYFGQVAQVSMQLFTNGEDAVVPTGPVIVVNNPVTWTYLVKNIGNVLLTALQVTDDRNGTIACPQTQLLPGAQMICTKIGVASAGQFANIGTVVGTAPQGSTVTDSNPSHYFGAVLGVAISKLVNDVHTTAPPGLSVNVGDIVIWTYIVTNTGNVPILILVSDPQVQLVGCEEQVVAPGDSYICNANSTAIAGQYANMGTARGTLLPKLGTVTASDQSFYFGKVIPPVVPSINIEKFTNGVNAQEPPGPFIKVGDVVTWTFGVVNSGNVTLTQLIVTDNRIGPITCPTTTLAPQELILCRKTGTAVAGQYTNIATATAQTSAGVVVIDRGNSSYFGEQPALAISTLTNGQDANRPTGPFVQVGQPVVWSYIVTNTGNVTISAVHVSDSQGANVNCPQFVLAIGESMTCNSGPSPAQVGQFANIGHVVGVGSGGSPASASDPSHYFGVDAHVALRKYTNGLDSDHLLGTVILVGETVTWTYQITNSGNVTLTALTLNDDHEGPATCPPTTLAPGQTTSCQITGIAQAGIYSNTASVIGTPPGGLPNVSGANKSYYFGAQPTLAMSKQTNGSHVPSLPGPMIRAGTFVFWTYFISNTGNIPLDNLVVSDDTGVTVTCQNDALGVGGTMACTSSGISVEAPYTNTGEVSTTFLGRPVTATAQSHYTGIVTPPLPIAAMQMVKFTNNIQADTPTNAPNIKVGNPVTWTYSVLNTGNVTLTTVVVSDGDSSLVITRISSGSGGDEVLAPLEQWTYQATGIATAGLYANLGMVSARPFDNLSVLVQAQDPSHYFGVFSAIEIKSYVNGEDADSPPGPYILVGEPVTWTYVVTNTSNITAVNVIVTDTHALNVNCPKFELAPDESMLCQADQGIAIAGQSSNIGTVSALALATRSTAITDSDLSHYFGALTSIQVTKSTNGEDANLEPGPTLLVGSPVAWTYRITNTSNVTLTNVTVSDDRVNVSAACPPLLLAPGASANCTRNANAIAGQYENQATVTGTPPGGLPAVGDSDESHYFGAKLGLKIDKFTNDVDADSAPGPNLELGSTVRWTYLVTNTSNVPLNIAVSDDQGVELECDDSLVEPGQALSCIGVGVAQLGQYQNVGTATASYLGQTVTVTDRSFYFGIDLPGPTDEDLEIKKLTNGVDADTARGPLIQMGTPVTWTYIVANSGQVTMTNVLVKDNRLPSVSCPRTQLNPRSAMICQALGVAISGPYSNTAVATANASTLLEPSFKLTATDHSNYFGATPSITIKTLTNGEDAPVPTGPRIPIGDPVNWTYLITNTGNTALFNIEISDVTLAAAGVDDTDDTFDTYDTGAVTEVTVTCPRLLLLAGQSMTCQGSQGTAQKGQYANEGIVTAISSMATTVTANDPSHYIGYTPTALEESPQPNAPQRYYLPNVSTNQPNE